MGKRREEDSKADKQSRRQKRKKHRRRKRIFLLVVEMILLVLVVGAAFVFFYLQDLWSEVETVDFSELEVETNEDLDESVITSVESYTTIACFGVDARDNETLSEGTLADTNIIVVINNSTYEVKLISVYRDLYVENTYGDHSKLTEVYSLYGALEQINTLNKNLDLNISEYVTVNWKAVAETIDALGGLDIELTYTEASSINLYIDEVIESTGLESEHVSAYAGTHHLDGVQAVTYCRLRNTSGSDYTRTERQRTVLALMLEAAKGASISELNAICQDVFNDISTSLTLTEILSLVSNITKYEIVETSGFPFNQGDGSYHGSSYVYSLDLLADVTELHSVLYDNQDYTPSYTVTRLSEEMASIFN